MRVWLPLFASSAACADGGERAVPDPGSDTGADVALSDVAAFDTNVLDAAPEVDSASKPLPPTAAVQVSVGYTHGCARTVDGHVRCWGSSVNGEVGPDARDTFGCCPAAFDPTPALPVLPPVKQVVASDYLSCAVALDGGLWCWGHGRSGMLADGVMPAVIRTIDTPELVPGAGRVKAVFGAGDYLAAIGEDQLVRTWGYNDSGQLGYMPTTPCEDGGDASCSATPRALALGDYKQFSAGHDHSCIVRSTGTVACWGRNAYGGLGDGTTVSRADARDVPGLTDAVAIDAGYFRTCALRAGNKVSCWGMTTAPSGKYLSTTTPVEIAGITGEVRSLAVGNAASCVLLESKRVLCWGSNHTGAVGNPAAGTVSTSAVDVVDLDDVVDLSAGSQQVCAVRGDGSIWCWGQRLQGGSWFIDAVPTKLKW